MTERSARCGECGYTYRLLLDGTIASHFVWHGGERSRCPGSREAIEYVTFVPAPDEAESW